MGQNPVPRHRAERPPRRRLSHLRRDLAQLLAGRDLYADDALLRPASTSSPDGDDLWAALPPPARPGRHPQPA